MDELLPAMFHENLTVLTINFFQRFKAISRKTGIDDGKGALYLAHQGSLQSHLYRA